MPGPAFLTGRPIMRRLVLVIGRRAAVKERGGVRARAAGPRRLPLYQRCDGVRQLRRAFASRRGAPERPGGHDVSLVFQRIVGRADAERAGGVARPLLDHVGQLVGQGLLSARRSRRARRGGVKNDVAADRIRGGIDRARGGGRPGVGMNSDVGEIDPQARFERAARPGIERRSSRTQHRLYRGRCRSGAGALALYPPLAGATAATCFASGRALTAAATSNHRGERARPLEDVGPRPDVTARPPNAPI